MENKVLRTARVGIAQELKTELVRKSIHVLVGFTPLIANLTSTNFTIGLLLVGTLFFSIAEILRINGKNLVLLSFLTRLAMRKRDEGRFVLGPVTLGIGASAALFFYPDPAATLAIYALAFGDGLSSLIGKMFGTIQIPFTKGKSLEGSVTCFLAVVISGMFVMGLSNIPGLLLVALIATIVEAIPLKDFDNIAIPLITGMCAYLVL